MKKIRRSYCGLCHPRCGTLLHIENGKVVKVSGDPDHPITRGAICERGRLMPDHIYHPQRLNYPLKRVGKSGFSGGYLLLCKGLSEHEETRQTHRGGLPLRSSGTGR